MRSYLGLLAAMLVLVIFTTDTAHADVPRTLDGDGVLVGSWIAPVQLAIFCEPQCPHCAEFESTDGDRLAAALASGTAGRMSLNDTSFLNHLDSRLALPFLQGYSSAMSLTFLCGAAVLVVGLATVVLLPRVTLRQVSGLEAQQAQLEDEARLAAASVVPVTAAPVTAAPVARAPIARSVRTRRGCASGRSIPVSSAGVCSGSALMARQSSRRAARLSSGR